MADPELVELDFGFEEEPLLDGAGYLDVDGEAVAPNKDTLQASLVSKENTNRETLKPRDKSVKVNPAYKNHAPSGQQPKLSAVPKGPKVEGTYIETAATPQYDAPAVSRSQAAHNSSGEYGYVETVPRAAQNPDAYVEVTYAVQGKDGKLIKTTRMDGEYIETGSIAPRGNYIETQRADGEYIEAGTFANRDQYIETDSVAPRAKPVEMQRAGGEYDRLAPREKHNVALRANSEYIEAGSIARAPAQEAPAYMEMNHPLSAVDPDYDYFHMEAASTNPSTRAMINPQYVGDSDEDEPLTQEEPQYEEEPESSTAPKEHIYNTLENRPAPVEAPQPAPPPPREAPVPTPAPAPVPLATNPLYNENKLLTNVPTMYRNPLYKGPLPKYEEVASAKVEVKSGSAKRRYIALSVFLLVLGAVGAGIGVAKSGGGATTAGSVSTNPQESSSRSCLPGTYRVDSTTCQPCEVNFYSAVANASACLPCSLDGYTASPGSDKCTCKTWYLLQGNCVPVCPEYFYGALVNGIRSCLPCSKCGPGQMLAGGCNTTFIEPGATVSGLSLGSNSVCTSCPEGTYAPAPSANPSCVPCSEGTYQSSTGKSKCNACSSCGGAEAFQYSACTVQEDAICSYCTRCQDIGLNVEASCGYEADTVCEDDCIGEWSPWSPCSASCNIGTQTRTFTITRPAVDPGRECYNADGTEESRPCSEGVCPVNCDGAWSAWSTCTKSCGGGQNVRYFDIKTSAAFGGANCTRPRGDYQTAACNTQNCPVPCVGTWSAWSTCSATCGTGNITRTFTVSVPAQFGGAPCVQADGSQQVQGCTLTPCPVDCVGAWGAWTPCSASCAGGTRSRVYAVSTPASLGGKACAVADLSLQSEACNPDPCPVDCVGAWGTWTSCSKSCGGGSRTRVFALTSPALYGGVSCVAANNEVGQGTCNTTPCPGDCVGAWSAWGTCSLTCGGGTQTRSFVVSKAEDVGGKPCAFASGAAQSQGCAPDPCPVPCVGSWSAWTTCTASCGGGVQSRAFAVASLALHGGSACIAEDGASESRACGTQSCAVDCVGEWGAWDTCTATCGGGTQARVFSVSVPSAFGGAVCAAADGATETQACGTAPCPVNCVGSWSAWGTCSASCGGGSQTRTFAISTPAANGGTACIAINGAFQSQACGSAPCPVDCVGSWSAWDTCTVTCGGGMQGRTFSISTPAANGGASCITFNGATQNQVCNTQGCPVDCVGSWSAWGTCSVTCGGGTQGRTFSISTAAANGGAACVAANGATQSQACNTQGCPVDCVGSWSAWGTCSVTCAGGTQGRTFSISTPAANGGLACVAANGATQSQACNTQGCPVNCVGSWTTTSTCTRTCGGGTQTQTYVVTTAAANGGTACPNVDGATRSVSCNTQGCPVNCVGSWTTTSSCTRTCGGGTQTQTYSISTFPANGGTACPYSDGATRSVSCNTQGCPVNCVGSWTTTTSCTRTCGGGTYTQTYVITTNAANGGTACCCANGATRSVSCNTQACPVNCVGSWSGWSACIITYNCRRARTYTITTYASNGGTGCCCANGAVEYSAGCAPCAGL